VAPRCVSLAPKLSSEDESGRAFRGGGGPGNIVATGSNLAIIERQPAIKQLLLDESALAVSYFNASGSLSTGPNEESHFRSELAVSKS